MSRSDDFDSGDRFDDRDRDDRPRRGQDYDDPATARRRVKLPAIGLIIVGVLYLGLVGWGMVHMFVFFDKEWDAELEKQVATQPNANQQQFRDMMVGMKPVMKVVMPVVYAGIAVLALLMIFGATKMLNLSSSAWAWAAAILSLVPYNCFVWVPAVAVGIWALVVLNNPDVKRAFAANKRGPSADRRDEYDR